MKDIDGLDPYEALALPLVREMYPKMIAKQLISVMPMMEKKSLTYHDDYKFDNELFKLSSRYVGMWTMWTNPIVYAPFLPLVTTYAD